MAAEPVGQREGEPIALDTAVDEAVAACDGDPRATVAALLVTLDATERELEALRVEVARIEAAVSGGYVRGRLHRREPGEPGRGTATCPRRSGRPRRAGGGGSRPSAGDAATVAT